MPDDFRYDLNNNNETPNANNSQMNFPMNSYAFNNKQDESFENFNQNGAPMRYSDTQPYTPPPQSFGGNYVPPGNANAYLQGKKKKNSGLKAALWCVCAGIGVVAAALVFFLVQSLTDSDSLEIQESHSRNAPYNRNSEVSYGEDVLLPDAPDVSADENGPQISTQNLNQSSSNENAANKAFKKASPSVVCISSYQSGSDYIITANGEGSGIIITEDGYIATNSHVVNDSNTTGVMITLNNGQQYLGSIIGIDKKTDLAVIKIDADGLTPADIANSDEIAVGDEAYAIGSPGGSSFSNTLTTGTVSAMNRVLSSNGYVKYIQTDAAINPGNSGGALINKDGYVIGMNTSKLVATDYEGMGFAIPSNTLVEIVNKLIKYGYVNDRGTLGIEGSTATLYSSKLNNIPQGMIISKIHSDSPLANTEVMANDIITAIDGKKVKSINEFIDMLKEYKPGDTVTLTIFRSSNSSGKKATTFDVDVILKEDKGN